MPSRLKPVLKFRFLPHAEAWGYLFHFIIQFSLLISLFKMQKGRSDAVWLFE